MYITLVHKDKDGQSSSLRQTIPRKYDVVADVLRDYCASKTGKQAGLSKNDVLDLVLVKANGVKVGPKEKIRTQLNDGDVVQVQEKVSCVDKNHDASESTAAKNSVVVSIGSARQLTKKAEDFLLSQAASWRGINFWAVAVCDGHGGQRAAASARDRLLPSFLQALEELSTPSHESAQVLMARYAAKALVQAFVAVDTAVSTSSDAGSTATMTLVLPGSVAALSAGLDTHRIDSDDEIEENIHCVFQQATTNMPIDEGQVLADECSLLVTANVGDSLAYIDEAPVAEPHKLLHKASPRLASHDHRLDRNSIEQQRCRDAGGRVARDETDTASETNEKTKGGQKKPMRLWPGGLMMSRALGDRDARQALSVPEIRSAFIARGPARLIVASDGLWDEMNAKQAFKLVAPIISAPDKAAEALALEAKKRGSRRNDTDDIAIVIVDLLPTCGHGSPVLRLWDVDIESGLGLAGPELDSALAATRRSKVAEAAATVMISGSTSIESTSWCGLAAEPVRFYEARRVLGNGGFGRIIECTERFGDRKVAIKVMAKSALRRKHHEVRARLERDALLALKGSVLTVSLLCAWHDEAAVYLVLPLAARGDLGSVLKHQGGLGAVVAAYYGAELICALNFVHSRGVLHRDVKPSNLLLDAEAQLKLCDLGLARPSSEKCTTQCGTPEYWSPEMVKKVAYGTATDLWSAAITVYELLAGFSPFAKDNSVKEESTKKQGKKQNKEIPETTQEAILYRRLQFGTGFDEDSRHLLEHWLERDSSRRLGVAADGISADSSAVQAHIFWRRAMSLESSEQWWRLLSERQIEPPVECMHLLSPDIFCEDKIELAKTAREARKFLMPEAPRDDTQSATSHTPPPETTRQEANASSLRKVSGFKFSDPGLQERRKVDPFDAIEYGPPGGVETLSKPRPSRPSYLAAQVLEEAELASTVDAVADTSVLAVHALGRGFLTRRVFAVRKNAANTLRLSFINCLERAALTRRLRALPRLRRASTIAAKAAKRTVVKEWYRFAARVACLEAARRQQRESPTNEESSKPVIDQGSRRKKSNRSNAAPKEPQPNNQVVTKKKYIAKQELKKPKQPRKFVPVVRDIKPISDETITTPNESRGRGRGRNYRQVKPRDAENPPENKTALAHGPRREKRQPPDHNDRSTSETSAPSNSTARGRSQGRGKSGRGYYGRGRGGRYRGRGTSTGGREASA